MANELVEQARAVGGDELAERVERLLGELEEVKDDLDDEEELEEDLIEQGGFSEEAVDGMDLQAMREVAEVEGIRSRTNVINVAGNPDMVPDSTDVTVNRSSPETYTKEVPLEAGDDPDTMTVEYEEAGPTVEAINNYHGWLNEARSEMTREERQEPDEQYIPTGVVNLDDVEEIDDENDQIPVAGQVDRESDDE